MSSEPAIYDCTISVVDQRTGASSGASMLAIVDHDQFTAYIRPFDSPDHLHVICSREKAELEIPRQVFAAIRPRRRQPS